MNESKDLKLYMLLLSEDAHLKAFDYLSKELQRSVEKYNGMTFAEIQRLVISKKDTYASLYILYKYIPKMAGVFKKYIKDQVRRDYSTYNSLAEEFVSILKEHMMSMNPTENPVFGFETNKAVNASTDAHMWNTFGVRLSQYAKSWIYNRKFGIDFKYLVPMGDNMRGPNKEISLNKTNATTGDELGDALSSSGDHAETAALETSYLKWLTTLNLKDAEIMKQIESGGEVSGYNKNRLKQAFIEFAGI